MSRALVSVYYKDGVVDLVRGLIELGWEILSSGGTATALKEAGLAVIPVEDVTGSPEMLDGRVKTIHPKIEGGILADRAKPAHMADLADNGIEPIDLVVCNLYPFNSKPSIELIDVGGPTMVRSAAKNYGSVGVVVDPADYPAVLEELRPDGSLSRVTRLRLAAKAFDHTAAYDGAISNWFEAQMMEIDQQPLPATFHLSLRRHQLGRYGENPHQQGGLYLADGEESWWSGLGQLGGKAMSYLNFYDTAAAWELVNALGEGPAVTIMKHANPCGVALHDDIAEAYRRAHSCDPESAFGGIVAVNRLVTMELATALKPIFTEVIIAPGYAPDALELLQTKGDLRILAAAGPSRAPYAVRSINGAYLLQTPDPVTVDRSAWRVVSKAQPDEGQWPDIELAYRVAAATSSNSIALVRDLVSVGIGAGQQKRSDAAKIAAEKAAGRAKGGVGASEAFFPFRDGLDAVAAAGVLTIVEPGGSKRDDEVIAAADEQGIALIFTGERHFRH